MAADAINPRGVVLGRPLEPVVADDDGDLRGHFRFGPPDAVRSAAQWVAVVRGVVMGVPGMTRIAILMEDAAWAKATIPPSATGWRPQGARSW